MARRSADFASALDCIHVAYSLRLEKQASRPCYSLVLAHDSFTRTAEPCAARASSHVHECSNPSNQAGEGWVGGGSLNIMDSDAVSTVGRAAPFRQRMGVSL
jgi:hypothetical protein